MIFFKKCLGNFSSGKSAGKFFHISAITRIEPFYCTDILEGVLILQNSFLKLKTVADNAILQNHDVYSESISERIKIKTENGFYLKALFPIRVGKGK